MIFLEDTAAESPAASANGTGQAVGHADHANSDPVKCFSTRGVAGTIGTFFLCLIHLISTTRSPSSRLGRSRRLFGWARGFLDRFEKAVRVGNCRYMKVVHAGAVHFNLPETN